MVLASIRQVGLFWLVPLCVALGGVGAPTTTATEPFGRVRLQADWAEADSSSSQVSPDSPRRIKLSLQSLVPLEDAELIVRFPSALSLRTAAPIWDRRFVAVPVGEGERAIRADLARLEARKPLSLEFEVTLPPGGGGVVSFGVEGTTVDGHRVREAIGFAARESGSVGTRRLGVVEFPATVLPFEERK